MIAPRMKPRLPDPTLSRLLRVILGPLVWALHLLVSYSVAAIWCARAQSAGADPLRAGLLAGSAVALALLGVLGVSLWRQWRIGRQDRPTDAARFRFLGHVALLLTLVSAVGVVFVTMSAVFAGSCR